MYLLLSDARLNFDAIDKIYTYVKLRHSATVLLNMFNLIPINVINLGRVSNRRPPDW